MITIFDYLLLPIYIYLFYLFIKARSIKYKASGLDKILIRAFFIHIAGTVLYALVIQYYYGYGDSFGFYTGSNFLRKIINAEGDPVSPFIMSGKDFDAKFAFNADSEFSLPIGIQTNSNLVVMKVSALLSYLSFNCYLIISLFFGMFAFTGLWKLYSVFLDYNKNINPKWLAWLVLYMPSIAFWGGGLIKDSLCLGATGIITYTTYQLFIIKKKSIKYIVLLVFTFYFLFLLKSYIATTLLAGIILGYVVKLFINSKKNPIKLIGLVLVLVAGTGLMVAGLSATVDTLVEESKAQIEIFKGSYANSDDENSKASFTSADFDLSVSGLVLRSPQAMFTTLFRPFLWETRKPIMFFSALESFLLLMSTLYLLVKCRITRFFYYIFSDPFLAAPFVFVILLSAIVGFTTFNFGTLVRYRLPILPFYYFLLLSVFLKTQANQSGKTLSTNY